MRTGPRSRRASVGAISGHSTPSLAGWAAILGTALMAASPAGGQQHRAKVPLADKIITPGPTRQAFTGMVASLDAKRHVLNVNTVEGESFEIFPLKKNTKVATANGRPMTLTALQPGTDVIVYYEQKGDQRSVENIVILAPKNEAKGKKSPPSS